MITIDAPTPIEYNPEIKSYVFLAGSIDMGTAEDWQERALWSLADLPNSVAVLNPRRKDWDSSWVQSIDNEQFRKQVEWERSGLLGSRVILFNFEANSSAPITLLELGFVAALNIIYVHMKVVVVCPKQFYRRGNVEIYSKKAWFSVYETLEEGLEAVKAHLK